MEWELLLKLLGKTTLIFIAIILYTRMAGLRSFSKISSFDFAMTIAVGSTISSAILNDKIGLERGVFGLLSLYFIQWLIAFIRNKISFIASAVDNNPILLMRDGQFLNNNLKKSNITKKDIYAKLRESNVKKISKVKAVIFETTGDISVIYGDELMDEVLLENVMTK